MDELFRLTSVLYPYTHIPNNCRIRYMNPDDKPLDLAAIIFFFCFITHNSYRAFAFLHAAVFASSRLGRSVGVLTACGIFRVVSQPIKFRKRKLCLKNCLFPFRVKFVPSLLFALLANCMASLAPKLSFLSFIMVFPSCVVIFSLSNMFV